ncbi:MAG: hypothetical protein WAW85_00965 [Gordonia sp. (in: high G+C Gram-positive bacteria)]|uniref:hypothetical protein n=1 Tax=Gordonia sp. (in: high G+C Gram-positive bacteria) TaxID=84139 RepID=UPI003BB4B27B
MIDGRHANQQAIRAMIWSGASSGTPLDVTALNARFTDLLLFHRVAVADHPQLVADD